MSKGIYKHHSHQGFQKGNKAFSGKKHSDETKRKLSKTLLGKPKPWLQGSKSYFWKGGKPKDNNGYQLIYKPKHPFCDSRKYVKNARLVAEKALGRYLTPKEIIHHINEIKNDDRPENLYLFATGGEHSSYHFSKIKPKLTSNLMCKKSGGGITAPFGEI